MKHTNKQTNKYISSQRQILALKLIIFAEEWEYLTRQRLWLVVYNIESKIRFYEKRPRHLFLLVSEWGLRKFALNLKKRAFVISQSKGTGFAL